MSSAMSTEDYFQQHHQGYVKLKLTDGLEKSGTVITDIIHLGLLLRSYDRSAMNLVSLNICSSLQAFPKSS